MVNDGGPTSNLGRVAVELFLLQLAKDDFVAAKKVLHEYGLQYCAQEEVEMCTFSLFFTSIIIFYILLDQYARLYSKCTFRARWWANKVHVKQSFH